ncbi:retropepsin-like aspartic protease [Massilia aurea]|uniref:retropepsin-like aspartic protease n=1 Tax=Massilia aurea TaxID=373040 RepID=UPI003462BBC8
MTLPFSFLLRRLTLLAAMMSSSAVLAQTLPAGCEMNEQQTVPLTFTDDMRPLVDASINGNLVSAMLNIGSGQHTVLNKKMLDRFGIKVRHVTSSVFRKEGEGESSNNITSNLVFREGLSAFVDDFSSGVVKGKAASFPVEDFIDDAFGARIGAGSLLQADLEIALDEGFVKHFKPRGCNTAHLAYWDPAAISVPIIVDVWKRDPRPLLRIQINGKDVWALLSTATPYSYLPLVAGSHLGLTPASPGAAREQPVPGHGQDQPVWRIPVQQMAIGGMEIKDFDMRLVELGYSGEIAILGADFLQRHRVYIAMGQRRAYFSAVEIDANRKRGSVDVIPLPDN